MFVLVSRQPPILKVIVLHIFEEEFDVVIIIRDTFKIPPFLAKILMLYKFVSLREVKAWRLRLGFRGFTRLRSNHPKQQVLVVPSSGVRCPHNVACLYEARRAAREVVVR